MSESFGKDKSATVYTGCRWEGLIVRRLLESYGIRVTVFSYDPATLKSSNPWSAVNVRIASRDLDKAIIILAGLKELHPTRK